MLIFRLFFTFLKIGTFSFGGGYAMIPFIESEIISANGWITMSDFTNIIAIAEMTPGPIAINSATFVGYSVSGLSGALAATLGVVFPSFILGSILSKYFYKFKGSPILQKALEGIRPIVLALIISATVSVSKHSFIGVKDIAIFVLVMLGLYKYKLHPILAIAISAIAGIMLY